MILYEDDFIRVTDGWFRGPRVIDKSTGAIMVPSAEQRVQFGLVWHKVRRSRAIQSYNARRTENLLMAWFGYAVVDPSSDAARRFVRMTPDEATSHLIATANDVEQIISDFTYRLAQLKRPDRR